MLRRFLDVANGNGTPDPHAPYQGIADNPLTPEVVHEWTPPDMAHAYDSVHALLCDVRDLLDELVKLTRRKDTIQTPIIIGGTGAPVGAPFQLKRNGYRHSRVFVGANVTITVNSPISASIALTTGWNLLDLPDGAEITAPTNTNAVLELTDDIVVR